MIDCSSLYLSPDEHQKVGSRFCSSIQQHVPGFHSGAVELLNRISSPNWAMEWGLPRWLGEAFDLPETTIHDLILANVFLLGFARITDDIIDEDFGQPGLPARGTPSPDHRVDLCAPVRGDQAILLGNLLQHLCLQQHMRLLARSRVEVDQYRRSEQAQIAYLEATTCFLTEWIVATSDQERRTSYGFSSFKEEDFLRMGHRGSLLKTCCVAACLLAGREEAIHPLISAVDQILVGVVLMDDAFDWAEDLEKGRYNVFIAYCSNQPQTREYQGVNKQAILRAIYLEQKTRGFFDLILEHISSAKELLRLVSIPKFSKFVDCLKTDIHSYQCELDAATLAQMKEASDRFMSSYFKRS